MELERYGLKFCIIIGFLCDFGLINKFCLVLIFFRYEIGIKSFFLYYVKWKELERKINIV